ncbi:MAG: ATP-binding protein, partial [Armatimonadota bacterium]
MLADFQSQLTQTGLLKPGDRIVVGYSGGADSGCLLHLLKQSGYEVIAAHLHHGQRQAADKELKLCELQCNDWGIPFVSGKADVPTMSKHLKVGIEEAGRLARYNFL